MIHSSSKSEDGSPVSNKEMCHGESDSDVMARLKGRPRNRKDAVFHCSLNESRLQRVSITRRPDKRR